MSRQAQISVSMKSDLAQAAKDMREQKRVQQELADALGLTRTEVKRLQRNMNKKTAADRASTASATKSAAAQANLTRATTATTVATAGATRAMAAMGIAANSALGPIGMIVAAMAAVTVGGLSLANSMSQTVDQVQQAAESSGVSTQTYLAMSRAIRNVGGDVSQLEQGLRQFVVAQDLTGKSAAEVDAALSRELNRIEAIEAPAERAAERMRLFGTRSSEAISALTSAGMGEARKQTEGLSSAIDDAAGSSSKMDASSAALSDAMTELAVVLGDDLAPSVIKVTDAVTAMTETFTSLTQSAVGQHVLWVATGGAFKTAAFAVVDGVEAVSDAVGKHESAFARLGSAIVDVSDKHGDFADAAAEIRAVLAGDGFISAPEIQAGDVKGTAAARKARQAEREAEIAEHQKHLERMGAMRGEIMSAAIRDASPMDAVDMRLQQELETLHDWIETMGATPDVVALAEQRRIQIEREAAEQRAQIREQERAREEAALDQSLALARERGAAYEQMLEQQAQAQRELTRAREDAALSVVSSVSQVVAATSKSAEAVAVARVLETVAYGAVATMRSFAELGPIAGIPAALAMAAATAAQIASIQSTPSRHLGSMAPDEGTLRVRNGERVTVDPATVDQRPRRQASETAILTIDNQAFVAMQRRSGRQDGIFGDRRRSAQEA